MAVSKNYNSNKFVENSFFLREWERKTYLNTLECELNKNFSSWNNIHHNDNERNHNVQNEIVKNSIAKLEAKALESCVIATMYKHSMDNIIAAIQQDTKKATLDKTVDHFLKAASTNNGIDEKKINKCIFDNIKIENMKYDKDNDENNEIKPKQEVDVSKKCHELKLTLADKIDRFRHVFLESKPIPNGTGFLSMTTASQTFSIKKKEFNVQNQFKKTYNADYNASQDRASTVYDRKNNGLNNNMKFESGDDAYIKTVREDVDNTTKMSAKYVDFPFSSTPIPSNPTMCYGPPMVPPPKAGILKLPSLTSTQVTSTSTSTQVTSSTSLKRLQPSSTPLLPSSSSAYNIRNNITTSRGSIGNDSGTKNYVGNNGNNSNSKTHSIDKNKSDHFKHCVHRISPWVVKHLMKPYHKNLITDRLLFKSLAKKFANVIIEYHRHPDEKRVKSFIEYYFCMRPYPACIEDVESLSEFNFSKIH